MAKLKLMEFLAQFRNSPVYCQALAGQWTEIEYRLHPSGLTIAIEKIENGTNCIMEFIPGMEMQCGHRGYSILPASYYRLAAPQIMSLTDIETSFLSVIERLECNNGIISFNMTQLFSYRQPRTF